MEKITSFTIDHIKLVPGVYVSRTDYVEGNPVTTFDLRMTNPNEEPVMNTAEVHTIGTRPFISAQWAAAPASIFCLPENTSQRISFL